MNLTSISLSFNIFLRCRFSLQSFRILLNTSPAMCDRRDLECVERRIERSLLRKYRVSTRAALGNARTALTSTYQSLRHKAFAARIGRLGMLVVVRLLLSLPTPLQQSISYLAPVPCQTLLY